LIPEQTIDLTNLEVENQPTRTYKLDFERKRIGGMIDNEQAIMQMVMKILSTERYAYVIYSSQYGVELDRMIGQDYDFIVSDLERTITEALTADDRVIDITDFQTNKIGIDKMEVSFTVNTFDGSVDIETEVIIL
jgi:hypothetical protein